MAGFGCAKGVQRVRGVRVGTQIISGPTGQIAKIEACLLKGLEEGLLKIAAADRRYKWYDRHELGVWWLPGTVPS